MYTYIGEGPNVKSDVILDKQTNLFFVIIHAIRNIQKGEEIFSYRFLGMYIHVYIYVHAIVYIHAYLCHARYMYTCTYGCIHVCGYV